jgi:hypothetical protein
MRDISYIDQIKVLQHYVQSARSHHSTTTPPRHKYRLIVISQNRLGREPDGASSLLSFARRLRCTSSCSASCGTSCGASCGRRSFHVANDELRCSGAISSICQMWCQDNSLTGADQIPSVADDLCVTSSDFANWLAVVWVAEDDGAVDEGCVRCREHVRGVVYELTTLTVMIVSSGSKLVDRRTYEYPAITRAVSGHLARTCPTILAIRALPALSPPARKPGMSAGYSMP